MTKVFQKSMSGGIKKYLQILFDELAVYGDEQHKISYKKNPGQIWPGFPIICGI